jgi:peptidoglycan/xylan/chitin deacetylase (PgdA/CDA1 family)
MTSRLLVLGWHNIEPTWSFPGTSAEVGRQGFERQLDTLRRFTHVVPLGSALADLSQGRSLPKRAVALTFDDGYLDNATIAAPLLRAAGLPATFFLVPGFLSGSVQAWWETLGWAFVHATVPELWWAGERWSTSDPRERRAAFDVLVSRMKLLDSGSRREAVAEIVDRLVPAAPASGQIRQFMNWDEARGLVSSGFDIGSHTCSHPILSQAPPGEQRRELVDSRHCLQAELHHPIDVFAYPNGRPQDYTATTVQTVREAGYRYAVTTRAGLVTARTPPYEIRRLVLEPETDLGDLLLEAARALKKGARRRFGRLVRD